MALTKIAQPAERRASNPNELPFMMKLSRVPDKDNPEGPSEWEELCELLGIDLESSPTQAAIALLEKIGCGDLVPEKKARVRGESTDVVVGIKLQNKAQAIERLKAATGVDDIEGGADAFRAALNKVMS